MPVPTPRRLAGFRFDAVPPALGEKLPRMDIGVLVGFASAGPLDVPVVLEEPAQFHRVFGEDLPLAWDAVRGRTVYAHLGPAVRAFFRNGGRRCWVIRVAGTPETSSFPLAGTLELVGQELRPAFARARSPGSGFDGFECATAVSVAPVGVTSFTSPGSSL